MTSQTLTTASLISYHYTYHTLRTPHHPGQAYDTITKQSAHGNPYHYSSQIVYKWTENELYTKSLDYIYDRRQKFYLTEI